MNQNDLLIVFKETFPTAKFDIPFNSLELNAIPEWVSLGNLNLILRIEEVFNIRFSSEELSEIKSIKQIEQALKSKGVYYD